MTALVQDPEYRGQQIVDIDKTDFMRDMGIKIFTDKHEDSDRGLGQTSELYVHVNINKNDVVHSGNEPAIESLKQRADMLAARIKGHLEQMGYVGVEVDRASPSNIENGEVSMPMVVVGYEIDNPGNLIQDVEQAVRSSCSAVEKESFGCSETYIGADTPNELINSVDVSVRSKTSPKIG